MPPAAKAPAIVVVDVAEFDGTVDSNENTLADVVNMGRDVDWMYDEV